MFKKKETKTVKKSAKTQAGKPAHKSGKAQTSKAATKNGKAHSGKAVTKAGTAKTGNSAAQGGKPQDRSDAVLAKLMAIEKEMKLEQARDRVDQLEDEKIAANIEQLLKIIGSGE